MKKLLLLPILLISFLGFAQDVEFMTKIRNLDEKGAVDLAKEIAELSRGDFEVYDQKENNKGLTIYLLKKGIEKEEFLKDIDSYRDDYFTVVFDKFYKGENKALEIEGTKTYSFNSVTFNYLDLFPFWQKYFSPNATPEETLNKYDLQDSRYKFDGNDWLYKFKSTSSNSKKWRLHKFY